MRGKSSAGSKGKSNRNGLADSGLLSKLGMGESPLIDQSHETEPKTLAESRLEEEISLKICYNCEGEIQDSESMPCAICNGECHLSCLLDTENGMVCNACKTRSLLMVIVKTRLMMNVLLTVKHIIKLKVIPH